MKHDCQYKIMFTRGQLDALKLEASEKGIPMSDLIRNKLFNEPMGNVQNNVQNNAQDVSLEPWYLGIMGMIAELAEVNNQKLPRLEEQLAQLRSDVNAHTKIIAEL